jgi:putative nucleotidyltransferase with HDIG domain
MQLSSGAGLFEQHVGFVLPWGHGLSWSAIQARETIESRDANNDPRTVQLIPSIATRLEQLAVPLFDSGGRPLGTLLVSRELQTGFTPLDKRLIEVIGRVAAGALERVQITRDLELQVQESQNLLSLAQLLEGNDEQSLLNALERVRLMGKADAAVVTELNQERITMRLHSGQLTRALQQELSQGMSLSQAKAFALGRRHFQWTQLQSPEFRPILQQLGVTATFTVVMTELNSLVLYRYDGDGWCAAERQMLEAAARMLGALVGRLERSKTLETGYASALKTIGLALEMRDFETADHTERVARLAEAVAERLRVPAGDRLAIRWGAYLHDIGKFGVPDAILQKSARLTEPELSVVRQHPQLGYDLVRDLPFLPATARDIVLYHHERWDGSGYPSGLAGEAIPLAARIFAVCDVFDALRSKRVYKAALSLEASLLELHREAERGHLEPRLVAALAEVVQRDPLRLEQALYPA